MKEKASAILQRHDNVLSQTPTAKCILMPLKKAATNELRHEISNNICATNEDSDQPAHTCSLIRAFASR